MSNCFVCLNKSKNKVCGTCECFAHPRCWGEYLKNSTNVTTLIFPTKVVVQTPYWTDCPICKRNIGSVKPVTRYDTEFGRRASLVAKFRNALFAVEMADSEEEKNSIFTDIFNSVIDQRSLFGKNDRFFKMIQNKLVDLYKKKDWSSANIYHARLFKKQISA
jgi:hypothetical protein